MKKLSKIFIVSLTILFLTAGYSCCQELSQESFYTGVPYYDNNKMKFPKSSLSVFDDNKQKDSAENANLENVSDSDYEEDEYIPLKQKNKKKWGIFKQKEKDPNQKTVFNYQTNKKEQVQRGYWGTLPDVSSAFKYKSQDMPSTSDIDAIIPKDGDISKEDLIEAPFDDSLFLEEIMKKEKPSLYFKDIQKTKFALNNLKKCIEDKSDMQRFIAAVNVADLYAKSLKKKYDNSIENQKESYNSILSAVYQAKLLGNLIYDSNYYARYTPIENSKYSKENISYEKQKLLSVIVQTLEIIEQET